MLPFPEARAGGPKRVRKSAVAGKVPAQGKRRSKRVKQENERRAVAALESEGDESGVEVLESESVSRFAPSSSQLNSVG